MTGLLAGPRVLGSAIGLLRGHRELWLWCLLPFALNLLVFAGFVFVFLGWLWEPATGALAAFLEVGDPEAWWQWIWVGPLRLLGFLVRWLLLIVFAVTVYFLFTVVGGVIAAPLLDELARRVERITLGAAADDTRDETWGLSLAHSLRSIWEEAKRAFFLVAGQIFFLFLGLIPGLQPLAVVGGGLLAASFLALDHTGFALDRRRIKFAQKRAWLLQNKAPLLSFGAAATLALLIPGLNFLCLPLWATAGTMLALEIGPPESA